jgi:NitT/TauT family transport system substrate-binding protein/putative hydroxymethylpyrimidine transport system substrate-binding protein
MPIVQRPLASVLAQADIGRPRDLEGRRVGVTGLPSDDAVLDSVVSANGGDPAKVDRVTIGFNAVSAIAAGKVDGATAFWNAEGVALQQRSVPIREFRVDDYGAPKYPELVLVTSAKLLGTERDLVQGVVEATTHGYEDVVADPAAGLDDLLAAVQGLDRTEQQAQLDALIKAAAFSPPGAFDHGVLEQWSQWDAEHGILSLPPNVGELFDLRPSE